LKSVEWLEKCEISQGNLFCERQAKGKFLLISCKRKIHFFVCEENPNLEREKSIKIDKTRIKNNNKV
jgi:hypothetical protein